MHDICGIVYTQPSVYWQAFPRGLLSLHGAGLYSVYQYLLFCRKVSERRVEENETGNPEVSARRPQLFYDTVHTVNAKDYSEEQQNVWATGTVDLEQWNRSFLDHYSLVAVEDGRIVGFGDIDHTGYLDRLYVHKDYQGQKIASKLCDQLERSVKGPVVTHASITARPFFEKRGYQVAKEQQVERQGILLTNFVMRREWE